MLAIDHDRLFKDLLTLFFFDFLALFFPRLAALIDPDSIEFLPQEVYTGLAEGDKFVVDVLVKARWKNAARGAAFFLIHVENQSTAPRSFLERFFRYHLALLNKHRVPVYPIVLYTHDRPRHRLPNVYRTSFPDGEVLRFTCRSVQLNRLPWRRFVQSNNPVASALMAKMKIAPKDRARVKFECLRLMLTLKPDPKRLRLIQVFLDTYLRLTPKEEVVLMRTLELKGLKPHEIEKTIDYASSWDRGVAHGRQEGRQEGLQDGAREELRATLLAMLSVRFGDLPASVRSRVNRLNSIDELRALTQRAFTAGTLHDTGLLAVRASATPRRGGSK